MKLNLIIPSFYPATVYGGPIFSTLNTCRELAKFDNIDIYVSTTNANMNSKLDIKTNIFTELEKNIFVKYYDETIINKISLSLFFNISKDIKFCDVIHIQSVFSISTPLSLYFAKKYKKPVLLSPRGQFGKWCLDNGSKLKNRWLKYFIKPFAEKIIWHATSQQEKEEILLYYPNATVEIIPNGIYMDEFKNYNKLNKKEYIQNYTNIMVDKIDKIIISIGRLQKKKGFDILIDSFYKISKKYSDSYLLIAGQDEGEKENLLKQIERLRLTNRVFLIGSINGQDKTDFLANADLFVLPSYNENFGNVYLESLAAGTPVIASKNTPWSDVEKADCGKWVTNSIDEITDAILKMFENNHKQIRNNAKLLAKEYDWENIAFQFKKIFEKMLQNEM